MLAVISRLEREGDPDAAAVGNVLYTAFAKGEEPVEPEALVETDRAWRALFGGAALPEAA